MRQRILQKKIIFSSFLFCFLSILACGSSGERTQSVSVTTASGEYTFRAELADNQGLRELGLMNRTDLTDESAMLFVWTQDTQGGFWMKDTPTSLDIIFISSNMSVNYIAANAVPYSTDVILPLSPYRYVLEVKAGFVERSGLNLGDSVQLR